MESVSAGTCVSVSRGGVRRLYCGVLVLEVNSLWRVTARNVVKGAVMQGGRTGDTKGLVAVEGAALTYLN